VFLDELLGRIEPGVGEKRENLSATGASWNLGRFVARRLAGPGCSLRSGRRWPYAERRGRNPSSNASPITNATRNGRTRRCGSRCPECINCDAVPAALPVAVRRDLQQRRRRRVCPSSVAACDKCLLRARSTASSPDPDWSPATGRVVGIAVIASTLQVGLRPMADGSPGRGGARRAARPARARRKEIGGAHSASLGAIRSAIGERLL